ncbi:hypothetical protein [Sphingomonas sp. CFBP 13706]|uniref:hypothetical protein n=1 Tax=Sphingomonas sp. CFBP 13706 TaxID=2775314 RepID=UPI001785E9CF|nr:hypothetical protein [Sphingomonas sp. CFBP 13706]MBD8735330.1 hypothetical protein [Sphingomonas sp. CFBP 13706]
MHGTVSSSVRAPASALAEFTSSQTETLALLIAERRERNRRFTRHSKVFSDPAWDILLGLLDGNLRGILVSTKSACIASGVPYTTALRYLGLLEDDGMILRVPDQKDGRRIYVELTSAGWREIHGYVIWLEELKGKRDMCGLIVCRTG